MLAAVDLATGTATPWSPSTSSLLTRRRGVLATVAHAGRFYVGGHFWAISGRVRRGIAIFNL